MKQAMLIFILLIVVLSLTSCERYNIIEDESNKSNFDEIKIKKNNSLIKEPTKPQDIITGEKIDCPPVFSHEFTDFTKIDAFQPIGGIAGASRGRSYITIKKGETVPVYAPTDATLVSVIYAYRGSDADHGEYGFKFDTKCNIIIFFDHIDSISDELKKYAPLEPSRTSATVDSLKVPIKGGTLLGYTDGTSQARTFDFLVIDRSKPATYINLDRWKWEQSLYSVCPYDLFEEKLREKYYQKIGTSSVVGFEKAKTCGNPSYDIAGTISGGWFFDENSTDTQGEFLLIGESSGKVDLTVKTNSEVTILRITDYVPKNLPKEIGVGDSVCYSGFDNDWAYLRLIDNTTIELSNGTGACPSSFPTTNSKKYYR